MKIKKKVDEESKNDWDFDFSKYETQDMDDGEIVESIKDLERPNVTGLRSRFSNGQAELERLADLNNDISKYSIKVSARTQDINDLWKYYAILDEFWESIRNIYGSTINNQIAVLKKDCRKGLEAHTGGTIKLTNHSNLLKLRSWLYRLKQLGNLGFEVDKVGKTPFSKAKRKVVEG